LLGGWILAGRMLAPLTRITEATRMAATGSLAHRIEIEGREDEFRELADAFDAMLARLEAHVAEQQRFTANASHELRTPLAITQALLDVARDDPNRDTRELLDRLHAVNTGRSTSPKHCSCSAAPTSGPSPKNTSTCPWQLKKPSKRFSPSRKSTASASRPPGTSLPPSAHTRSCCS
jgi:HAMP domain-containing protein